MFCKRLLFATNRGPVIWNVDTKKVEKEYNTSPFDLFNPLIIHQTNTSKDVNYVCILYQTADFFPPTPLSNYSGREVKDDHHVWSLQGNKLKNGQDKSEKKAKNRYILFAINHDSCQELIPPNFKIKKCELRNNILKVSGGDDKEEFKSSFVNLAQPWSKVELETVKLSLLFPPPLDFECDNVIDKLCRGPHQFRSKKVLYSSHLFSSLKLSSSPSLIKVIEVKQKPWSIPSRGYTAYFCVFYSLGTKEISVQKLDIEKDSKIVYIGCIDMSVVLYEVTVKKQINRHTISKEEATPVKQVLSWECSQSSKLIEIDNYLCDNNHIVKFVTTVATVGGENNFIIFNQSNFLDDFCSSSTYSVQANTIYEISLLPNFAEEKRKCRELLESYLLKDMINIVLNYLII
jgi:hypothetical protein